MVLYYVYYTKGKSRKVLDRRVIAWYPTKSSALKEGLVGEYLTYSNATVQFKLGSVEITKQELVDILDGMGSVGYKSKEDTPPLGFWLHELKRKGMV